MKTYKKDQLKVAAIMIAALTVSIILTFINK